MPRVMEGMSFQVTGCDLTVVRVFAHKIARAHGH